MKRWQILSILMSGITMLGSYAWSDEGAEGPGPRWVPRHDQPGAQRGMDGRAAGVAREDAEKDQNRQKAELEATLKQLREKAAQTEALLMQIREKAEQEYTRRPPPVREQIQLRQDKPMPIVIRFNHISAGSFVKTLEQLARNPKVAEALKDIPLAVNDEANAVVLIMPPAAAELLTNLAKDLDQPTQYHKAAQHEGFKFNLPVPPGAFGPVTLPMPGMPAMPGMPGSKCPMQGGSACPMKPGSKCPMQSDGKPPMPGGTQCPMLPGMKVMPGGQPEDMRVIIQGELGEQGNIMQLPGRPMPGGIKVMPGAVPMPPAAQGHTDPRISEALELLETALKNQNNSKLAEVVKFLQILLKDQIGQKQPNVKEEHEKAEKHPEANKPQSQGKFRIQIKDDDDQDDD